MVKQQFDGKPQSSFSAWVRDRATSGALPSSEFATTDIDWIWHGWNREHWTESGKRQYRHVRYLMLIEEKACSAKPDFAQHDTISLLHKIIDASFGRKNGKRRAFPFRTDRGEMAVLRYYGYHLLQYDETDIRTSAHIAWDKQPITLEILESILRFKTDPERIDREIDVRLHHAKQLVTELHVSPLGFVVEEIITRQS
jgi:hypothetical protein